MAVQDDLYGAIDGVYEDLNDAYWAASTIQDKDFIKGSLDVLDDLLTELNRASFADRTAMVTALGKQIDAANKQLTRVKGQIDQIVHAVDIATAVAKAADEAITIIGKVLAC